MGYRARRTSTRMKENNVFMSDTICIVVKYYRDAIRLQRIKRS